MTQSPKEKADELIEKFKPFAHTVTDAGETIRKHTELLNAKQSALIAVNEMIHYLEIVLGVDKQDFKFWQQVKAELEKK